MPRLTVARTADLNENSNALSEVDEASAVPGSTSACGEDKAGCEHICDDTSGRAVCLCYRGYTLSPDDHSCIGKSRRHSALDRLVVNFPRAITLFRWRE